MQDEDHRDQGGQSGDEYEQDYDQRFFEGGLAFFNL
jgi:hypothetical protein